MAKHSRQPAEPVALSVITKGFALTEAAAEPDGRRFEVYRDFIVLAPYQHLWFHA